MKPLDKQLDDIFRRLVKLRSNHYCEATGEYYENDLGLDCSHVFKRGNMATRWHPKNAYAHGREIHSHFTDNDDELEAWCREKMGDAEYEALQAISSQNVRIYDEEKEELLAHYKAEFDRISAIRDDYSGRIEFSYK